jgi:hypothetical protein
MSGKNKNGLSRIIPNDIKRSIRQRNGFGCVICGNGIIQYEHVDPTFQNAFEHKIDNITLLCPQCHSKVTTGYWHKNKVKDAMQDPYCLKKGFSREFFDIGFHQPEIKIGGVHLNNCSIPIMIKNEPLIKFERPEIKNGPFLLSALFFDSQGNRSLSILQNEWISNTSSWDFEIVGKTLTIREAKGEVCLRIEIESPRCLIITKLDMLFFDIQICADKDNLNIKWPSGSISSFRNCICDNCTVGISI